MIGILTTVLALLFLAVLLAWALGFSTNRKSASWSGSIKLPSRLIRERISSREDFQFVGVEAPEFRSQFLRDRKILMLICLQQMRAVAIESFRIHRTAVSLQVSMKPAVELRLAGDYLTFLLLWELARSLVWISNPVAAQSLTARVYTAAEELSDAAKQLIATNHSLRTEI
ncbi:MAG: hypothetical protein A3F68_12330 [Acidobacteria bacterium RIFCSPLOWO2_12_FULL_54_10]|nr:MAG: hypothetical protein A3F68_12330 [Acidobacteria bacterium RIFCSPLOWO2_12_FULL_54_10]